MKKFCSDVVQDFLPPLVDPVKHEAQEMALKKNAAIGTYLKSIIGIQENQVDVYINQSPVEPNAIDPVTNQMGNELSGLHLGNQLITPISEDSSVRPESDLDSGPIDDALANEIFDVNEEEDSIKEKSSTSRVLESISLGGKDSSKASLICEFSGCDEKNACSFVTEFSSETSVCVVECQSAQEKDTVSDNFADNSVSVSDASNTSSASEVAFSVVSCVEEVSEPGLMSSTNSQLSGSNSLHENLPENFATQSVCCNDPVDGVWSVSDCSEAPPSSILSLIASLKDNAAEAGLIKSCSVLSLESGGWCFPNFLLREVLFPPVTVTSHFACVLAGEDVSRTNYTLSLSETSQNSNAELCGSAQFDAHTFSSDSGMSKFFSCFPPPSFYVHVFFLHSFSYVVMIILVVTMKSVFNFGSPFFFCF